MTGPRNSTIDALDARILHALQCSPRIPFRRIADVLDSSEQTVARRYQALRRNGIMRVIGLVDPAVHGQARWVARIRCRPDRIGPLADSLTRRPDVAYANLASGGSEIICILRSPVDLQRDDLLLRQLPRSGSVLDLSIDLLLHDFGRAESAGWTGYGPGLTAEQVRRLKGEPPAPGPARPASHPAPSDAPLIEALAQDGRTTHTHLATVTGWPASRVSRRLEALESSGTLVYEVDLLPERLGFHLNATLWLRVPPKDLQRAGAELASHDQVAFAGATSGEHNLMGVVICRDADDFYRYLSGPVAAIPGVTSYNVSIRVRRLKQAATLIAHGRLVPSQG